jgi:hypothetical protein
MQRGTVPYVDFPKKSRGLNKAAPQGSELLPGICIMRMLHAARGRLPSTQGHGRYAGSPFNLGCREWCWWLQLCMHWPCAQGPPGAPARSGPHDDVHPVANPPTGRSPCKDSCPEVLWRRTKAHADDRRKDQTVARNRRRWCQGLALLRVTFAA